MKPNIITIEKSGIRYGDLWPLSPILGYDSFALCFCSSWQINLPMHSPFSKKIKVKW
jgi:hypothetical protein